jgi:hypothetical protein
MPRAVLLLVVLAGCRIGGGPTLGYRKGHVSPGWQIGLSAMELSQRHWGYGLETGQSWNDGKASTFGAFTVDAYETDVQQNVDGADAELGLTGPGYHGFVGLDAYVGRRRGNTCAGGLISSFSFGLRIFGRQPELYFAPRLDFQADICGD